MRDGEPGAHVDRGARGLRWRIVDTLEATGEWMACPVAPGDAKRGYLCGVLTRGPYRGRVVYLRIVAPEESGVEWQPDEWATLRRIAGAFVSRVRSTDEAVEALHRALDGVLQ